MHPDPLTRLKETFEDVLGHAVREGNEIRVLKNGREIFPAMLEAIGAARRTIEFLTFVYWKGEIARRFAEALSEKARQGVKVRVILDAFGCRPMADEYVEQLTGSGAEVEWFRPLLRWKLWKSDHRTHRKILVCDRETAFTGGVGIADEWDGDAQDPSHWRDTHFRVRGPAVSGIFSGFVGNWIECGRDLSELHDFHRTTSRERPGGSAAQVIRSPAAYGWTDFTTVIRLLVSAAKERIRITTAYFNPDAAMCRLLGEAAARGVEVTILAPGRHTDQWIARIAGEAKYEALLASGVRILHYEKTMLHAKVFSMDGLCACIGSPNFNQRSMQKDDELGLVIFDPHVVAVLDGHFEEDGKDSMEIDPGLWKRRGPGKKMLEKMVTLLEKEI